MVALVPHRRWRSHEREGNTGLDLLRNNPKPTPHDPVLFVVPPSLLIGTSGDTDYVPPSFIKIVMRRYGLCVTSTCETPNPARPLKDISAVELAFGCVKNVEILPPEYEHVCRVLVTYLLNNWRLPAGICDIAPDPVTNHPLQYKDENMDVERLKESVYLLNWRTSQDTPWSILLFSATSTLEVIRECHNLDNKSIARQLIKWGIPFHTV